MAVACLGDGRLERPSRANASKNVAPVIPAIDDVIERAAELNAQSSGHPPD